MRGAAILVLAATIVGCVAADWDDLTFSTSLDQSSSRVVRDARRIARYDRQDALRMLQTIPAALQDDEYLLMKLRLLSSLGRPRVAMRLVESADASFRERAFADYLGPYLRACGQTGELDRFHRHVASLRYVENDASRKTMLRGVLALLAERRFPEAGQMLEMYPPAMFPSGDWTILRAATDLYAGRKDAARARIGAALGLSGGSAERFTASQRAILYDLMLLASDWERLGHSELMILSGAPLAVTRRNLAALALHHGLLDLAAAKLEELPASDSTRTLNALAAWKRGDTAVAEATLGLVSPAFLSLSRQGMLLLSELDYLDGRSRDAERDFKQYLRMDAQPPLSPDEERYANYAIGWAFHGYFRFSNAAYWWIKNLSDTQASMFDSLATADLAALYTFTEHHEEARKYYRRLARRYPEALRGDVITAYLDNLRMTGHYATLQREFLRLYEEAPAEKRAEFARVLGDVLYDRDEWRAARDFYRLLPSDAVDDEVVWRRERCSYLLGDDADVVTFLNRFISMWPENQHAVTASLDLVRYYLETDAPELALAQPVSPIAPADTVAYLHARALAMQGETDAAREILEALTLSDSAPALRHRAVARLDELFPRDDHEQLTSISLYYAALADSVREQSLREDVLLRLATRYEDFALPREAMDVYTILMASPAYVDTGVVRLRMAKTQQSLGRWESSLDVLQPVWSEPDHPHAAEAFALEETARTTLLTIATTVASQTRRGESYIALGRFYERRGLLLPAWRLYMQAVRVGDDIWMTAAADAVLRLEQEINERYPDADLLQKARNAEKLLKTLPGSRGDQ